MLKENEYEMVVSSDYVRRLQENGAKEVIAEKKLAVIARKSDKKEKLTVYISDGNVETEEYAEPGEWILTRTDQDGDVYIDNYGHINSWIMKPDYDACGNLLRGADEKIDQKYDLSSMTESGLVKPRGGPQIFIEIDRNIRIEVPWGIDGSPILQYISKGGFLNITNSDNIYGIAKEEFESAYRIIRKCVPGEK